jgi:hypothetical protein
MDWSDSIRTHTLNHPRKEHEWHMLKRSSIVQLGTLARGSKLSSTIAIILECSCGVCRKCFTPQIQSIGFPLMIGHSWQFWKCIGGWGSPNGVLEIWRLTKVSVYCYHVVSRWAVLGDKIHPGVWFLVWVWVHVTSGGAHTVSTTMSAAHRQAHHALWCWLGATTAAGLAQMIFENSSGKAGEKCANTQER